MKKLPFEFIAHFKYIVGAFSVTEALGLYQILSYVPEGIFAEFGTHKGKSGSVLALGLPKGFLHLIEPEFTDKDWTIEAIQNVTKFKNPDVTIYPKATTSLEFIPSIQGQIVPNIKKYSFVFVDSSVHDDMVMEEVKSLEDLILENGVISFHDYLNQFTAVERAFKYLLSTGKYEEIKIEWQEIFDYVKEHNLEEGNNSWHLYPELPHPPNFVGALRRK